MNCRKFTEVRRCRTCARTSPLATFKAASSVGVPRAWTNEYGRHGVLQLPQPSKEQLQGQPSQHSVP